MYQSRNFKKTKQLDYREENYILWVGIDISIVEKYCTEEVYENSQCDPNIYSEKSYLDILEPNPNSKNCESYENKSENIKNIQCTETINTNCND